MTEDRTRFSLECCKAFLITLDGFGVMLEADAALIRENDYGIASWQPWSASSYFGECNEGTNPSVSSCFNLFGTLKCHHCQSVASLGNTFPDLVRINVES